MKTKINMLVLKKMLAEVGYSIFAIALTYMFFLGLALVFNIKGDTILTWYYGIIACFTRVAWLSVTRHVPKEQ